MNLAYTDELNSKYDNGKLVERQGRKAIGSKASNWSNDSLVTETFLRELCIHAALVKVGAAFSFTILRRAGRVMAVKPPSIQKTTYTETKEKSSVKVLLHSRTMVEKKDFVSTGILTHIEGDIIEIEIPEYQVFSLGDEVKLTIYSPGGIFVFQSTVVAKDNGSVIVINPPQNQKRFLEKREHPRIDISHRGRLVSVNGTPLEAEYGGSLEFIVNNVSLTGVGFSTMVNVGVQKFDTVEVEMDFDFKMVCKAEIIRIENQIETEYYFGAKLTEIPEDKQNSLRAFILRHQVKTYFGSKKKEETKKRVFK